MEEKTFTDADGNEVIGYKAEDVKAALAAKEAEFNTGKTALETKLAESATALAQAGEKDKDFAGLRAAKTKAEADLVEFKTKAEGEINTLKTAPIVEHKGKLIGLLADGDKAMAEKIELFMSKDLKAMPEGTKAEVDAKIKAAFTLATEGAGVDRLNQVVSSSGGGTPAEADGVKQELKSLGKAFGLTDKDFENAKNAGVI